MDLWICGGLKDLDMTLCLVLLFRFALRKIPRYERNRERVVQEVLVCGSGFSQISAKDGHCDLLGECQ